MLIVNIFIFNGKNSINYQKGSIKNELISSRKGKKCKINKKETKMKTAGNVHGDAHSTSMYNHKLSTAIPNPSLWVTLPKHCPPSTPIVPLSPGKLGQLTVFLRVLPIGDKRYLGSNILEG